MCAIFYSENGTDPMDFGPIKADKRGRLEALESVILKTREVIFL